MNYQQAVEFLRQRPEMSQLVLDSYLEADNQAAAARFFASEEFAQIADWLDLHGTRRTILDVGCGNGIAAYSMAKLGHQVTALDPDSSDDVGLEATRRLSQLLTQNEGEIECVASTIESFAGNSDAFDAVYTRQAVHHFADLDAGLRACYRVLKPGGFFLATREHVVSNGAQLEEFLAEHALHKLHGGENAYSLERYQQALRDAGFVIAQTIGPWDSVVNHFPLSDARVAEMIALAWDKRLKLPLGKIFAKNARLNCFARRLRSRTDHTPGRLYSFLCTKPVAS